MCENHTTVQGLLVQTLCVSQDTIWFLSILTELDIFPPSDFPKLLPALSHVGRSAVAANEVDHGGQTYGDGYP